MERIMIRPIYPNQNTNCRKPLAFGMNFKAEESVYKPINEAWSEIAKFSEKPELKLDVDNFLAVLKENFEKATEKIKEGSVTLYHDNFSEGLCVKYTDENGKRILSTIPILTLFKKNGPNHEVIIESLSKKYNKIFECTQLPETNPFK